MDIGTVLAANFTLANLVTLGLQVIFIAIIFEFSAWWLGRRIEALTAPMIPNDSGREPGWRTRRRTTLRQTPKMISRALCYTAGLLLIFNVFNVPVLPLSIGLGAIVLLCGAAILPLLRDMTQGYALLADDLVAPGDVVEINGHRGAIEKWSLRGLWIKDEAGRIHCLSNRNVQDITVLQRRAEAPPVNVAAFDPLAKPNK